MAKLYVYLAFKAETDDVRSSPAVKIVSILLSMGAKVQIYDPRGAKNAASLVPNASFMSDPYEAAKAASCIVILTEWEEFKELNFEKLGNILAQPTVFDFRNMLDTKKLRILGFNYNRLGKCLLETSIQEYHF
jgi:UDPglucose 6-dehydrogenase